MLVGLEGHKVIVATCFKFKALNNEVKYEVLIGGLRMAQVPRLENSNVDALAKLASSKDSELLGVVPVEELEHPTIDKDVEMIMVHAR